MRNNFLWKHNEISPHPQTHRASLFVSVRHLHACTFQDTLWFTARAGDLHLSRCAHPSMPALRKIKTTDLFNAVLTDTGMPYIKPKNHSFPSAFSFLPQNIPFPPPLLPSHLSKAKETETEILRGEVAPHAQLSLHRWRAEFHLKMFGIVFRWIKMPQPDWLGCDIFGQAAINMNRT